MKSISFLFSFLFLFNLCHAQLEESIHQSFEIDEINSISINLKGDVAIQTWAGNTILTETKVKLYDASPGILNHFVKLGRYEIEAKPTSSNIYLTSKDIIRRPIRTKKGECYEEVKVQVFLPDDFVGETETVWKRKTGEEIEEINVETAQTISDSLIHQDTLLINQKDSLGTEGDGN